MNNNTNDVAAPQHEEQAVRTVTYVKPEQEQESSEVQQLTEATLMEPAEEGTQASEAQQLDGPPSRAMQFLPQNGHRCQTSWQFWYYQRQTPFYTQQQMQTIDGITRVGPQPKPEKASPVESQSFRDQLKPLGKIPTLEHFFNYYVHFKKPTEMPREIDIHFFRDDLVPMWEVS